LTQSDVEKHIGGPEGDVESALRLIQDALAYVLVLCIIPDDDISRRSAENIGTWMPILLNDEEVWKRRSQTSKRLYTWLNIYKRGE
jgi:hypothetical protein